MQLNQLPTLDALGSVRDFLDGNELDVRIEPLTPHIVTLSTAIDRLESMLVEQQSHTLPTLSSRRCWIAGCWLFHQINRTVVSQHTDAGGRPAFWRLSMGLRSDDFASVRLGNQALSGFA